MFRPSAGAFFVSAGRADVPGEEGEKQGSPALTCFLFIWNEESQQIGAQSEQVFVTRGAGGSPSFIYLSPLMEGICIQMVCALWDCGGPPPTLLFLATAIRSPMGRHKHTWENLVAEPCGFCCLISNVLPFPQLLELLIKSKGQNPRLRGRRANLVFWCHFGTGRTD